MEDEEAETEEKYQVFGLSTGIDGGLTAEEQTRHGEENEEILGK